MLAPQLSAIREVVIPGYDKAGGEAVLRAWREGDVCCIAVQSEDLCHSAARILSGLRVGGRELTAEAKVRSASTG